MDAMRLHLNLHVFLIIAGVTMAGCGNSNSGSSGPPDGGGGALGSGGGAGAGGNAGSGGSGGATASSGGTGGQTGTDGSTGNDGGTNDAGAGTGDGGVIAAPSFDWVGVVGSGKSLS